MTDFFHVECGCGKRLRVKQADAGKSAACPHCGRQLQLVETPPDAIPLAPPSAARTEPPAAAPPAFRPPDAARDETETASQAEDGGAGGAADESDAPHDEPAQADRDWKQSWLAGPWQFYRTHGRAVWLSLADRFPRRLRDDDYSFRQIRVPRDVAWRSDGAVVPLPTSICTTCGSESALSVLERTRVAPDCTQPLLWGFLACAALPILSCAAWQFLLAAPLVFLAAVWIGGRYAQMYSVRVRFAKCRLHEKQKKVPALRVFGRRLWVSVGDKRVRQRYLRECLPGGQQAAVVSRGEALAALEAAKQADRRLGEHLPWAAAAAGWMWYTLGFVIAAWVAVQVVGLAVATMQVSSDNERAQLTGGSWTEINPAALVFVLAVLAFLGKVAHTLRAEGRALLSREADDLLSKGFASLGIGCIVGLPGVLVFSGRNLALIKAQDVLASTSGKIFFGSLLALGAYMCLAGVLALLGRNAYVGATTFGKAILRLPCPACGAGFAMKSRAQLDTYVQCDGCGETFRLQLPEK